MALAVLMLSATGLGVIGPQFVRHFIDMSLEGGALSSLYWAAAFFLGFTLAAQAVQGVAEYVGRDLAWRVTNRLRCDLLLHVLRLDLSFHNARTPGELQERIDGDVSQLNELLSDFVMRLLTGILLALGISIALLIDDWRIALPMLAFFVLYVFVYV